VDDVTMTEELVFELPSLGADMEAGTVLQWYVAVGDEVERGDLVALVSTEKADIDVEIWQSGRIAELLVDVGVTVPVGTPLIRLEGVTASSGARPAPEAAGAEVVDVVGAAAPERVEVSAEVGAAPAGAEPVAVTARTSGEQGPTSPARAPSARPGGERPLSSPLARTLAAERGIDLRTVHGTGPGGAVVASDLDAVPVQVPAPAPVSSVPPAGEEVDRDQAMRQAIAARMARANRDIPHYHLDLDVDVTPMLEWLDQRNRDLPIGERVLPAALFMRAAVEAAWRIPELNGAWINDRFRPSSGVHLGVVISLRRGGLLTPTIAHAEQLGLNEIMASLRQLVAGARTGAMRSSWMGDASLTVTNLGDNGADRVGGVIFPPQVCLVGFGRVRERPWVLDGQVAVRRVVTVSLAADHRASDGATGSRFLAAVADLLATPTERPADPGAPGPEEQENDTEER
jgi:pyruvate dehydrogenase E2 component (dihydrolipoamide acetyltransferase)